MLGLVLLLEFRGFGAFLVDVVVAVWIVRFFELRDEGFDGERFVVVEFKRAAIEECGVEMGG